jgi:hypothetical protein
MQTLIKTYRSYLLQEQLYLEDVISTMKTVYKVLFPNSTFDEELAIKILNSPLSSVFQEKFIELIRDNLDKFNLECIIISNSNQILKVIINENNSN